jgi:hypothetical protein
LNLEAVETGTVKEKYSRFLPTPDIDSNGIVGLSDLVALAQHYGQHYP